MDSDRYRSLFDQVEAVVMFDEPMARHTTWRIGGPADVFAVPTNAIQVQQLIAVSKDNGIPWLAMGRGSNLLVRDGGIRGLVIALGDALSDCTIDGNLVTAYAGRSLVSVAYKAIRQGLSGLEFATGIPGSVGGAVAMNAGAHGAEIKEVLKEVDVVSTDGLYLTIPANQLHFAYRSSALRENGWIAMKAVFALHDGDSQEMQERTRAWAKRRQNTQPLSLPSCGSVFRNPVGDYSARLIETCGLKGKRIGDAQVSEKHANFIVNLGQAKASDVLALLEFVQQTVKETFGVELLPEVRVVGEK